MREYADAIRKDLKEMEFTRKTKGPLGFEFSLSFRPGSPVPIRRYREKELETEVVCGNCTLRYSVYGFLLSVPTAADTTLSRSLRRASKLSQRW